MRFKESTVTPIVSREFLPKKSGHMKSFAAILNVDKRCARSAWRDKLASSRSGPKPPAGRRFESSYTHHHVAFERRVWNAIIAADSPGSFVDDTPTAALIRQVLGAVAQFEKAALVAKLKGARDRQRRETGKCEGRMSRARRAELAGDLQGAVMLGEAVRMAKRLRRANPKTGKRMSLRKIAGELAEAGHVNERGVPYQAVSVKRMLET